MEITTKELRIQPGKIIDQVVNGQEVTVTYRGEALVKIVSLKEQNKDIDKKWSERVWWLDRPIYMAEHNIIEESTEDLAE